MRTGVVAWGDKRWALIAVQSIRLHSNGTLVLEQETIDWTMSPPYLAVQAGLKPPDPAPISYLPFDPFSVRHIRHRGICRSLTCSLAPTSIDSWFVGSSSICDPCYGCCVIISGSSLAVTARHKEGTIMPVCRRNAEPQYDTHHQKGNAILVPHHGFLEPSMADF